QGLLTPEQIRQGRRLLEQHGESPIEVLARVGTATQEDIARAIAEAYHHPYLDLAATAVDGRALAMVPAHLCRRHMLIPVSTGPGYLVVAMADPLNLLAVDEIRLMTHLDVRIAVASPAKILNALARHQGLPETVNRAVRDLGLDGDALAGAAETAVPAAADAPIVKLVHTIITEAVRHGASDIHIEPLDDTLVVRYRVDGVLHDVMTPPKQIHAALLSRIKIMANVDIGERRLPQDGRFRLTVDRKEYDFRVSTMPTIWGEKVGLRILDKLGGFLALDALGISPGTMDRFLPLVRSPQGMILVTGPTGSGKSTTLASVLATINTPEKNILTIEDPVEYRIRRLNQVEVNVRAGLTFARALRHFLRQDPDVVMVGEIRDHETAEVAIHAALTGHLVLSTLHTTDAPSAIARLIDMGAEPFLIASSLIGVLAQRLVRTLCPRCRVLYAPPADVVERLGLQPLLGAGAQFFRPKGCEHCRQTGYRGRTGVFELLVVTEATRTLIMQRTPSGAIRQHALEQGMTTMLADGLAKAASGVTSIEEVLRVVSEEE
ncbi:MAG: type II/IV secretion system protein, partial [Armatimonadetes bacterium]|nr:type II/IV secretion system protein [Armatimonadota bacterium]